MRADQSTHGHACLKAACFAQEMLTGEHDMLGHEVCHHVGVGLWLVVMGGRTADVGWFRTKTDAFLNDVVVMDRCTCIVYLRGMFITALQAGGAVRCGQAVGPQHAKQSSRQSICYCFPPRFSTHLVWLPETPTHCILLCCLCCRRLPQCRLSLLWSLFWLHFINTSCCML